jgi:hypothetical protein
VDACTSPRNLARIRLAFRVSLFAQGRSAGLALTTFEAKASGVGGAWKTETCDAEPQMRPCVAREQASQAARPGHAAEPEGREP